MSGPENTTTLLGGLSGFWKTVSGAVNSVREEGMAETVEAIGIRQSLQNHEEYGADAQKLFNRLESNEPLRESLGAAFGGGGGSRLEMARQIETLAAHNPAIFKQLNNIIDNPAGEGMRPGVTELLDNIAQRPALRDMLTGGALAEGSEADPAQRAAALAAVPARLEAMVTADPAVFEKLNDIIEADGFDKFMERVAGNESLSGMFQGMMGGGGDPAEAVKGIGILHKNLAKKPSLFNDFDDIAESHPRLFAAGSRMMAANPEAAFKMMSGAQNMMTQMGAFMGMIQAILPPQIMQMVSGFLGKIAPQLNQMLGKMGIDFDVGSVIATNSDGALARSVQDPVPPTVGQDAAVTRDPELERVAHGAGGAPTPMGG